MTTKLAIAGAGRMGKALAEATAQATDLELVAVWTRGQDLNEILQQADVLVDFSLKDGTEEILGALQSTPIPLVCGVSGLDERQMSLLNETAKSVPIVYDRNMSLGIAVLENCITSAVASLGGEFSVEIHETHHVHKKDAPSGTALKLADAVRAVRAPDSGDNIVFDVERRGEVLGEHSVVLRSASEELVLSHRVTTRQVFADGALRAARWVRTKKAGLYGMTEVLLHETT